MKFKKLRIRNFGAFRGEHELNLQPNETSKPIILIGGKNGSGKTTFCKAIRLCLYGKLAAGNRISDPEYQSYLEDTMHWYFEAFDEEGSEVELTFDYVRNSKLEKYKVIRRWNRAVKNIHEEFEIWRNGERLDEIKHEQWDEFIRDMIPPRLSELVFFDGEQIQRIAECDEPGQRLGQTIEKMLGLKIVDQLEHDLSTYMRKHRNPENKIQIDLEKVENKIDTIKKKMIDLNERRTELSDEKTDLNDKLEEINQELLEEGYGYAKKREHLEQRIEELEEKIENQKKENENKLEGLIPFALVPTLIRDLLIELEKDQKREANKTLDKMADNLNEKDLESLLENTNIIVPEENLNLELLKNILSGVARLNDEGDKLLHPLSIQEREKIIFWLTERLPQEIQGFTEGTEHLGNMEKDYQDAKDQLYRVPDKDIIKPLVKKMNKKNERKGEISAELSELTEAITGFKREFEVSQQEREKLLDKIANSEDAHDRLKSAGQVQVVLDRYRHQLKEKKINRLSVVATKHFKLLARKDDFVGNIIIDPESYSIKVEDSDGRIIPLAMLSAGEKQICVTSILWGLRDVSGKPLPILIDTPLSRLDRDHRHSILTQFFPNVSHQVILLPTDAEIYEEDYELIEPFLSRVKTLSYRDKDRRSTILDNYFPGSKSARKIEFKKDQSDEKYNAEDEKEVMTV